MRIYRADRLIDGSGAPESHDMEVIVENGRITRVAPTGTVERPADTPTFYVPGATLLPGFIDVHVHLMFGTGARTYEDVIEHDSDESMLLRAPRNAYLHLGAGVTTMRDCGARNNVGFALRAAVEAGYFLSPRLLVCGRPLTITGGHFWWCNQEADGPDSVRRAVRQLMKDGADFLKIMASGGGTAGTDSTRASFTIEELRTAVQEAHQVGKKSTAHCLAADSVARAAEAGLDQIEHFNFLHPDGSRVFDEKVADTILRKGIVLSPTIQTGYRRIEQLQANAETGSLTPQERRQLDAGLHKLETKLDFVNRFHEMGAPVVAGTDAIQVFGDYAIGLELLHRAGLSNMDVIQSATSRAAKSIDVDDQVGTVGEGLLADLVYVEGDPLTENHPKLRQIRAQLRGAREILAKMDSEHVEENTTPNPLKLDIQVELQRRETQIVGLRSIIREKQDQQQALGLQAKDLLNKERHLIHVDREIELQTGNVREMREKLEQARVNQELVSEKFSNIHVFQPATFVERPVSPNKKVLGAGFTFLGLMIGLALSFLRDGASSTLRTADDVESRLGTPVVATIPWLKNAGYARLKNKKIYRQKCRSLMAEILMTQHRPGQRRGRSLGVIGVDVCAGASTLAVNLAISSDLDCNMKTVLVDADSRNRSVSEMFGLNGVPGLVELLSGAASHDECLQKVDDGKIELIASSADSCDEMLSNSAAEIEQALEAYLQDCDLLIVDLRSYARQSVGKKSGPPPSGDGSYEPHCTNSQSRPMGFIPPAGYCFALQRWAWDSRFLSPSTVSGLRQSNWTSSNRETLSVELDSDAWGCSAVCCWW